MLEKLVILILGWLMGLLAGPISEKIRRERRRSEVTAAVMAELKECRHLMASLCYRLRAQIAQVDTAFLDWVIPIEEVEAESSGNNDPVNSLKRLRETSASGAVVHAENRLRAGTSLVIKTYDLPLLRSSLADLTLIPVKVRREILAIFEQLDLLNQDAPYLNDLHKRTFDPALVGANRERVVDNLENGYRNMADRAQKIADRISRLIDSMDEAG